MQWDESCDRLEISRYDVLLDGVDNLDDLGFSDGSPDVSRTEPPVARI